MPIQEVSTPSSPSRRSPRRTNSPQSGNEGNFGKINVSPNDQSRDSQADHDVASDSVVPGLVADDNKNVEVQLAQPDFDSLDPYSVLGVPEQATIRQIKMTYHKLSKQYHPDRLPSLPNQQDAHTTTPIFATPRTATKPPCGDGRMIGRQNDFFTHPHRPFSSPSKASFSVSPWAISKKIGGKNIS